MALKPNLHRFFRYTHNGKYSQSNIDRFISHIDTTPGLGPNGDCWEWTGWLSKRGYGRFKLIRYYMAHRVAYELFYNKLIPEGMCVCHHCDNPKCVRVDHLFLGTYQDNMDDMVNKGRSNNISGEEHYAAKLTLVQVGEIRRLYNTENYTMRQLADKFNVSAVNIDRILQNKIWYDKNYIKINIKKGNIKLSRTIADDIRRLYATGKYTRKQLVDKFNVSKSTINDITNNRRWESNTGECKQDVN